MPGICPSCNRQATIESEFCPACGAPMNPDAYRIQEERKQRNALLLPMKWHKFVIWVSLPLGGLTCLYNLYLAIMALIGFQPEIYRPDALPIVRIMMLLDLAMTLLLIPCFILAEIGLIRKKWAGVKRLLFIYLSQAVYAFLCLILAMMASKGADPMTYFSMMIQLSSPLAGMLILFFLVRCYYRKRKCLFQ